MGRPGNPNPSPATRFKKGSAPGRPKGTKNKTTLLKEKILAAALKIDLEGGTVIYKRKGKEYFVPNINPDELVKVAAGFVPREIKGEGFETNITLANVLGSTEIDPGARDQLITFLRKRQSPTHPT